jgi:hypothetical protein
MSVVGPNNKPTEVEIAMNISDYIQKSAGKPNLTFFIKKKYGITRRNPFTSFGYGKFNEFLTKWKIILPEYKKSKPTEAELIDIIKQSFNEYGVLNWALTDIRTKFGHGPFSQFGFGTFDEFTRNNKEKLGICESDLKPKQHKNKDVRGKQVHKMSNQYPSSRRDRSPERSNQYPSSGRDGSHRYNRTNVSSEKQEVGNRYYNYWTTPIDYSRDMKTK